jgi:hypothetical protein
MSQQTVRSPPPRQQHAGFSITSRSRTTSVRPAASLASPGASSIPGCIGIASRASRDSRTSNRGRGSLTSPRRPTSSPSSSASAPGAVASAPAAFRVQVWQITSWRRGPHGGRPPPEGASVGYAHTTTRARQRARGANTPAVLVEPKGAPRPLELRTTCGFVSRSRPRVRRVPKPHFPSDRGSVLLGAASSAVHSSAGWRAKPGHGTGPHSGTSVQ